MAYEEAINTIDILLNSLQQTKELLESGEILKTQLYGNFDILTLVYNTLLECYGEEALSNFQDYYTNQIIKILKENIKADSMVLKIEQDEGINIIKASILTSQKLVDVFYLNPYFKSIIIINDEKIEEYRTQLNQLYEEESLLLNEIEELQMAKTNPIYYAKDDALLLAKMTIQKSKYEKILNDKIAEKNDELLELKQNISEIETNIHLKENNNSKIKLYRDRYIERLKKLFQFSVIKEDTLNQLNNTDNNNINTDMFSYEKIN